MTGTQHDRPHPPAVGWTLVLMALGVGYVLTGSPPMQVIGAAVLACTLILPFLGLRPPRERSSR